MTSYQRWYWRDPERAKNKSRRYRRNRYKTSGCWRDEGPKARALKLWYADIKSNPCRDCGRTFPVVCMDFDHRDGSVKLYNVGSMVAHHYNRGLIEEEIAKCDLVCANCHRIRTAERRTGSGQVA